MYGAEKWETAGQSEPVVMFIFLRNRIGCLRELFVCYLRTQHAERCWISPWSSDSRATRAIAGKATKRHDGLYGCRDAPPLPRGNRPRLEKMAVRHNPFCPEGALEGHAQGQITIVPPRFGGWYADAIQESAIKSVFDDGHDCTRIAIVMLSCSGKRRGEKRC